MKKVNVPEGKRGDWEVKKFVISKYGSRSSINTYGSRAPLFGKYTKLTYKGKVVMSDTDAEIHDHLEPVQKAKGDILINGLGLGLVLLNCMEKSEVISATIIERSIDVIALVAPHYINMYGERLEIIHADAMTWKPPKGNRYGMVWHDIWPSISADNYEQMKTLHRRYGRRCDWQGSWCKDEAQKLKKKKSL